MSASIFTLVPDGQYVLGRQSARRSPIQCQAPATGCEVLTFRCFSTLARALDATGLVKTTEIGMATPTVVPVCGVIVSSSIGGPAGFFGEGEAVDTPIGRVPATTGIDTSGLDLDEVKLRQLLEVDEDEWREELPLIEAHFAAIGERLPQELQDELASLEKRLAG